MKENKKSYFYLRHHTESNSKKFFNKMISIIACIGAFLFGIFLIESLFSIVFSTTNTNNAIPKNISSQSQRPPINKQKLIDSSAVLGFVYTGSDAIEKYCIDTGYIPYDYINTFKTTTNKTYKNAMKYIDEHVTEAELSKVKGKLQIAAQTQIESEFLDIYKEDSSFTRKEFCQMFDTEKDNIIQEMLNEFKKDKPHMFLD